MKPYGAGGVNGLPATDGSNCFARSPGLAHDGERPGKTVKAAVVAAWLESVFLPWQDAQ
ncbi:hypothetical protein ETAR_11490 [Edwardsiella tarda]